ncbi:hypothetical protein HK103_000909 [Boothiomyces macroporosus]|uniref:Leucyl/phenylalanyl-tRNA--protein transferase n=1 Tax=Boothiomyces macroporosus TaxID=261099 RepID=A0AAD5YA28_9FUNG|nr:hypothetical protein HK103_000909 [Boothiomyces macroporosus]
MNGINKDLILLYIKHVIRSIETQSEFPELENLAPIDQSEFTIDTLQFKIGDQISIFNDSRLMLTLEPLQFLDIMQYAGRKGSTPLSILLSFREETFCYTELKDVRFMVELMYEGYLPIFQGCLLPKLHDQRCCMVPNTHIPKKVYKHRKMYRLTVNTDFEGVVKGVDEQHSSWFKKEVYEGLVGFEHPYFKFYSIELWKGNDLVAGDLGYTVGSIYTSMTGFYRVDGAGTVLLTAIKLMLVRNGFSLWDLGMGMQYKLDMGAKLYRRAEFLGILRANRTTVKSFKISTLEDLLVKM